MNFKSPFFLAFLFLTVFLSGCKNKNTQFFINYPQEVTLPAETNRWTIAIEDIQTDCRVRFEKNDTKRSKVDNIVLKNIALLSQEEIDFKKVELRTIHMQCPSISKKRIAFKDINTIYTDSSVQFQLLNSEEDVKEFIKHNQFSIELKMRGEKLKKKIKATIILEFLVEGELIKTILHQRMLV